MRYREKAGKIRNKLKRYSKLSVIKEVLEKMHDSNQTEAFKTPWVAFLLIEWLLQVDEVDYAQEAKAKDVYRLMNEIYHLQADAINVKGEFNVFLELRRIAVSQGWVQKHELYDIYYIIRLHSILLNPQSSSWFAKEFHEKSGLELKDFFIISVWVLIRVTEVSYSIPYSKVVSELSPNMSIETIKKYFCMVGGVLGDQIEEVRYNSEHSLSPEYYFSDSILLRKPFFYLDRVCLPIHSKVLTRGLSEFVFEQLKQSGGGRFKDRFGREFERYVGKVLDDLDCNYIDEQEIKEVYRESGCSGKVVDFLINEGNSLIFVDAKGIDPHVKITSSVSVKIIRDKLKDSFLKGMEQAVECASLLSCECDYSVASRSQRFAIVVTYEEFYISNARRIKEVIDPAKVDFFEKKYKSSIPIENIFFLNIEDFEGIVLLCKNNKLQIARFLGYCRDSDMTPASTKLTMRQHIIDYSSSVLGLEKKSPIGSDFLQTTREEVFHKVEEICSKNIEYWRRLRVGALFEYMEYYNQLLIGIGLQRKFTDASMLQARKIAKSRLNLRGR